MAFWTSGVLESEWRQQGAGAEPDLTAGAEQILANSRRKVEGWLRKRLDDPQAVAELTQEAMALAEALLTTAGSRTEVGAVLCRMARVARMSGDGAGAAGALARADAIATRFELGEESLLGHELARTRAQLAAT